MRIRLLGQYPPGKQWGEFLKILNMKECSAFYKLSDFEHGQKF